MPSTLPRHLGRAAGVLALTVAPLAAQPVAPPPAGARPVVAPVAAVPRGERVRVILRAQSLEGWAQGTAGDTLLVRTGAGELARVPAPEIDALWLRDRRATARGAAIGAGVGGALLAGVGVFFVRALCESPSSCRNDVLPAAVYGGLIGAAGGGGIGALIGSLVPAWRRVHP